MFLFFSYFIFSQEKEAPRRTCNQIEEAPVFPGCEKLKTEKAKRKCLQNGINAHVDKHFNMDLADELNLAPGRKRIIGIFKIDKKGDVTNITVIAPHPKLKEEAIRMLKKLPKMIPGNQRGIPVVMKYALPINFVVEDNHKLTKDKK